MKRSRLTATIWREGDSYVALCPELDVSSCGDDPDHALTMLKEAVELFIENAHTLGIWQDVAPAVEAQTRFTASFEVTVP